MKKRFLFQNLISFLIPAFIPLLIFSLVVSMVAFQYTRQEVEHSSTSALSQSQQSLDHMFNTAGRIGADIASSGTLPLIMKSMLQRTKITYENYNNYKIIQSYLQIHLSMDPVIASIYVYINNPHGQFYLSNGSLYSFSSFYDAVWYETYKKNRGQIHSYYELRTAQKGFTPGVEADYLTLYSNLFYPGSLVSEGVVVVNLRMDAVRAKLSSVAGHPQAAFLLLQNDGKILCASNNATSVLNLPSLPARLDLAPENSTYMLSSLPSASFPWQYCLITPYSYAYRMPHLVLLIMLLCLTVSLLLAFVLSCFSSRRIRRSLTRIMEIFEQAQSDHPAPVPPNAPRNSYDYIIQNLLEVFMKQDHLKVQLSERHYRLQVMELLALQSQINPHFLYNTLQTIYLKALSFTGKPNEVNNMLEHLMVILRYALSSPTCMASLGEDLTCARSYVYLEQQQYGPQLCVDWHVDDTPVDVEIPRMLIQPLVENCIRHGMRGDGVPLKVEVHTESWNGSIAITVADNGRGVAEDACRQICSKLHAALIGEAQDVDNVHIGLFNTAKRLYLSYPAKSRITFASTEGSGTSVTLYFPQKSLRL